MHRGKDEVEVLGGQSARDTDKSEHGMQKIVGKIHIQRIQIESCIARWLTFLCNGKNLFKLLVTHTAVEEVQKSSDF